MSQARVVARVKFFKADHPRTIDHYIDYFGSGRPAGVSPEIQNPLRILPASALILRIRRTRQNPLWTK